MPHEGLQRERQPLHQGVQHVQRVVLQQVHQLRVDLVHAGAEQTTHLAGGGGGGRRRISPGVHTAYKIGTDSIHAVAGQWQLLELLSTVEGGSVKVG